MSSSDLKTFESESLRYFKRQSRLRLRTEVTEPRSARNIEKNLRKPKYYRNLNAHACSAFDLMLFKPKTYLIFSINEFNVN